MTVHQLLACEKVEPRFQSAPDCQEYMVNNERIKVYWSRPISMLADENVFLLRQLQVKVADFGFGSLNF